MNLIQEKEKIKKEIDQIQDESIIEAIKKLLVAHEDDTPSGMLHEPAIEDWEMASPEGRTPTRVQLREWLEREDADDENMTAEEALSYMKKTLAERRANRK